MQSYGCKNILASLTLGSVFTVVTPDRIETSFRNNKLYNQKKHASITMSLHDSVPWHPTW